MTQTTTPTDAPVGRQHHVALTAYLFLVVGAWGFLQPLTPLYLEASRLTQSQAGVTIGLGTGLALVLQALLGHLSDRMDARRPWMVLAAVAAGLACVGLGAAEGMPALTLLVALTINGFVYLVAAGGVLIGRIARGEQGATTYANYRVWGSVGYVAVALLTGWWVSGGAAPSPRPSPGRSELAAVFTFGALLFFAIALVSLRVPDRRNDAVVPSGAPPDPARTSLVSPNLRWFLLAFFGYQFALSGALAFLSFYLKGLGAVSLWITATFAAGVVSEVLVMRRAGRLADRYGRRPLLAVPFLVLPLRLLLYLPATGPLWVLLVQTLEGLNFGIMGAVSVAFVNDLARDGERGAAQARLATVWGLASALGPIACGALLRPLGIAGTFAVMAGVGALGALIFLTQVAESHPKPLSLAAPRAVFLRPLWRLLANPKR